MPGGTSRATVPVLLAEANDLGGGQAGGPAAVTAGTRSSATSGLTIAVISFMGVRLPWNTPTARLSRGAETGQGRRSAGGGATVTKAPARHAGLKAGHAVLDQAGPEDLHWRLSIPGRWAPWTTLWSRAACG